jgi:hypothetical protein
MVNLAKESERRRERRGIEGGRDIEGREGGEGGEREGKRVRETEKRNMKETPCVGPSG